MGIPLSPAALGEVKLYLYRDPKNADLPERWAKMRSPRILVEHSVSTPMPNSQSFMVLLLAAAAAAQEPMPVFGVVHDAGGEPIAEASVTCVGTPWFRGERGDTEVVTVQVDARGRWIARLDPALTWSVWSTRGSRQAGDDAFTISAVRDGVRPGHQAPLKLSTQRARQRLELEGASAWPELEGLHVGAVEIGRHLLPLTLDAQGRVPPLPPIDACHVVDRAGELLAIVEVERTAAAGLFAELLPPRDLGVRVVDEKGKVLAGADVYLDLGTGSTEEHWLRLSGRSRLRKLGRTADDGLVTVRVPARVEDFVLRSDIKLQARKDGFRWTGAGIRSGGQLHSGGVPMASPPDHILNVTLLDGGKLTVTPDGARDVTLVACVPGADWFSPQLVPIRLDEDGRARLPFRGHEPGGSSDMVLRTMADDGTVCWSRIEARGRRANLASRRLRLQVVDPERGPPHGARAVVRPFGTWLDLPLPLDAAGRAAVDLGPGDWMVFVCDGRNAVWRSLRADDGVADWSLELEPMARAAVEVFDSRGRPAAFGRLMFGLSASGKADEARGSLEERQVLSGFATRLMQGCRLDSQGRTDLPILLPELEWQLSGARCPNLENQAQRRAAGAGGLAAVAVAIRNALVLVPGEEHQLQLGR